MNKKQIILLISCLVIICALITGYFMLKNKLTDNEKFAKEYGISNKNVFVYRNIEEIINIMEHGTGIVYLGFPECPWCKSYVNYINDFAKEVGIDKIYYFNILEDRTNNTKEYQKMITLLKNNLQYDEEGNERIFVPNLSFHISGEVIGNDYETSLDTKGLDNPKDYWTNDEVNELKDKLIPLMKQIKDAKSVCSDCNK